MGPLLLAALPPSPARTEAALVAPAPPPEQARPSSLAFRAGAGVGLGDTGFGGSFFGQFDAFPLTWLGVGFEGEAAGMEGIPLLTPADSSSFRAARGRATLRWVVQRERSVVALGAAVGVGPGAVSYTHYASVPCDDSAGSCDDGLFGGNYAPVTTGRRVLSTSLELSLRVQWKALELGGFLRYVSFEDQGLFTLGPTLGAAF